MRHAILSILAILAVAALIAAVTPAAEAKNTYLFAPYQGNDGGGAGN
jgi:hypothetical protein